jgi:hypothetical protein
MFDYVFDLQMFAEDEASVDTVDTEVAADEAGEQEEEKEPIPEELGGLPEEAAREVMAEAEKLQQKEEEPQEDTGEVSKAEEEGIVKNQAIPYSRFKQKVDESNALKAELESYKAKYGELNAQPAPQPQQSQPAPQQVQYQPAPQEMPPLNLTPEVVKQIDELKKQEALRMTGLSQEDLDGMEYMEDTDPRKQQYQFALKMAESNIVSRIQQARIEQAQQAEAFMQAHNASVADYNAFAQKEMAAPDFQQVMKFATEDYFAKKSPAEQQTIANAYVRVERNTASPAEVLLIKNYFTEAKNAFHGQKSKPKNNPMAKAQQAASFPRSQQVEGSSDNDTGVSVATLEKLLAEKPWDEIPEKYQKKLMGE